MEEARDNVSPPEAEREDDFEGEMQAKAIRNLKKFCAITRTLAARVRFRDGAEEDGKGEQITRSQKESTSGGRRRAVYRFRE